MIVSDEQVEEAINFLSSTDSEFARLKTEMETLASKKDITEKTIFQHEDGNVEERKAKSRTHENTKHAQWDYLKAMQRFEELKNKRDTAHVNVWVWRSLQQSGRTSV